MSRRSNRKSRSNKTIGWDGYGTGGAELEEVDNDVEGRGGGRKRSTAMASSSFYLSGTTNHCFQIQNWSTDLTATHVSHSPCKPIKPGFQEQHKSKISISTRMRVVRP